MWKVRLQYRKNYKNPIPEFQNEFPYQYLLYFSTHHTIHDGFCNINICKWIIDILNQVISNEFIDDKQLGYHNDGTRTEQLIVSREKDVKENESLRAYVNEAKGEFKNLKNNWYDAFEINKSIPSRTLNTYIDIDRKTTKHLSDIFKNKGVSFNSGLVSLISVVLVDILNEKGLKNLEYSIGSMHAVDCRRYWNKNNNDSIPLGLHFMGFGLIMKTPRNVKENIWSYVKSFHKKLSNIINSNEIFDHNTLIDLVINDGVTPLIEDIAEDINKFRPSDSFSVTNMGDVTSIIGADHKNVRTTWISRAISIKNFSFNMMFMPVTFRERLNIPLDYDPAVVPTDVAILILQKLKDLIHKIANEQ